MINKVYLASSFSIIHVAEALISYPCTLTALTYNSDVNGSPEDPVVRGVSVTEIHASVIHVDLAEFQPAAVLAGISLLGGDSSDTLEGETHHFSLTWCMFLQSSSSSLTLHLLLHHVPNYICVVTAAETWTGNIPSYIHNQIFCTVFRLVASQTFSLQHLQVEGPVPAAGQQKKMMHSPRKIELIIFERSYK